jgi:AbrB family looped-hinge helix DNA binding protein
MSMATLTSKGQTTIPREVREFLNLKSGDKLEFKIDPARKTVTVKAANIPIADLKGILKRDGMKPYEPKERTTALRRRALRK